MKTLLALHILLAFLLPAGETLAQLNTHTETYQEKSASESVHLQLSEEVLSTGEVLWFQGFLSASERGSQEESKVLYVEVLNNSEAVLQGIYSIKNGVTHGQIQLPDTLSGGWYQLRAYTQWMRNFEAVPYWSQPIMIINPYEDKVSVQQPEQVSQSRGIAFFPEGGNYVEGLPNRLLLQLSEEMMMDSVVSAQIISVQDSLSVAHIEIQSGQGVFTIIPEPDKDYVLEVYLSNRDLSVQDTLRKVLPAAQRQGTTLQAQFEQSGLQLAIHHSKKDNYTVLLRSSDALLYSKHYNDDGFSANLDPQPWPSGILELSVVDTQKKVLAQRILYHTSAEKDIQITLDKAIYLPREEVAANISLTDVANMAQMAVTVRKVNPLTPYLEDHRNTLSLIDETSRYATLNDAQRAFRLNQVLIAKEPSFPPLANAIDAKAIQYSREDESLTVSGKVQGLNGKEVEGKVVVLSVPGTNPYFEYDFVDEDGSFRIPVKENVVGRKDIVLQMADTSLQVQWALDEKFMQENTYSSLSLPAVPEAVLKEVLQSHTQRSQIRSQYDLYYVQDSTTVQKKTDFRFYGAPNFEIRLENYIDLPNFVEVNRELMPGIRLRETKEGYNLDVFDIPSRTFLPDEPSVFLDGVLIHDLNYLVNFPPGEMELIETVNRRTYYGEYRFDGTIAIYTKEGNAYLPTLSSSAKQDKRSLYTSYQPFSGKTSLQTHEPDFRTLLHWQPSVKLGREPYTLTFKNADELGEFEIIVEGMTEDGKKIYGRKTYAVSLKNLP